METPKDILDQYKLNQELYAKKRLAVERAQKRFDTAAKKIGIASNVATPLAVVLQERMEGAESHEVYGPFGLTNETSIALRDKDGEDIFWITFQLGVDENKVLIFLKDFKNNEKLVNATEWSSDQYIEFGKKISS